MGDALGSLGINGPFLLSQAVNFLILFGLLSLLLWKPALRRLEGRREMLRKQQEDAAALNQARAEMDVERKRVLEEARAEANRLMAEAREQARGIVEQAGVDGRQQTEKLLLQARQDAEEERNLLLGQMRGQIVSLSIAAAHRLIGDVLDEQRQRALVESFFSGVREGRVTILPAAEQLAGLVTVTSAIPLTEAERGAVRQDLARLGGAEIAFQVNPEILGGLVIRAGDRVIDGSFAGQLEQLRQKMA